MTLVAALGSSRRKFAVGALNGKFKDHGISDDFIKSIRDRVTEGTSAVFLLTSGA